MQALINGHWVDSERNAISVDNRSFRYGAGIFETIRFEGESAPLWDRHMIRLLQSSHQLGWDLPALFTTDRLREDVLRVIKKNKLAGSIRVRITASFGEGGLFDGDGKLSFLIEAWPLDPGRTTFNNNGWVIGCYDQARKSADWLSRMKSTSALIYTQAAAYARSEKWNDALILNSQNHLCDSCIANLFLVRDGRIITTDSEQGAVEGVMQGWLIDQLQSAYSIERRAISPAELIEAEEVFLTNALFGIRWVGRLGDTQYANLVSDRLYRGFIRTIFV
jgi:branched-chain amino acid aminotransferase